MDPINLKKHFGDRYRIALDDAAVGEPGLTKDPWYFIILCQHGHIYPHSDKLLGVFCDGPRVLQKLAALPSVNPHQLGDGEAIYTFPLSAFDTIAEVVHPRKKRRQSKKQQEAAMRTIQAYNSKVKKVRPSAA
jgi:hypothetical protein